VIRSIVNVAFGSYLDMQARLARELHQKYYDARSIERFYSDLPPGCPPHKEKPYAFKAYALEAAAKDGADLLLWLDSSIFPIRSLEPLWERIEKEGYWIARNGWTNYQWTAFDSYKELFKGMNEEQAVELNKTIPHVVATAFGLNMKHFKGKRALELYVEYAKGDAFRGPWKNTLETPCGPHDVLGHRHDQTALSVIAWALEMQLTDCPEIFSYPPAPEKTILVADGGRIYG